MNGIAGLARELALRLVRNWPRKVMALLAAAGFWWLVTTTTTTITQRNFSVPLLVEGVEEEDLAVGVPDFVDVGVSGPGPRIDRLRPDQIRATLDLAGAVGDFDRQIVVQTPNTRCSALVQSRRFQLAGTSRKLRQNSPWRLRQRIQVGQNQMPSKDHRDQTRAIQNQTHGILTD